MTLTQQYFDNLHHYQELNDKKEQMFRDYVKEDWKDKANKDELNHNSHVRQIEEKAQLKEDELNSKQRNVSKDLLTY